MCFCDGPEDFWNHRAALMLKPLTAFLSMRVMGQAVLCLIDL